MSEVSLYPTALDSTNIYEVVARLSTTLTADITAATTTIPLASTTGFPTQGYIVIDNETIEYISVSVSSVNATGGRGHAGTAASHTNTTQVLVAVTAAVFNKLRAGLIAVQTALGTTASPGILINKSGDNLLLNPEFQVGATANLPLYWALSGTPTLVLAADTLFPALGGNQITITAGAAYQGIGITPGTANWLKIKPSTTYTFSVDYKMPAGNVFVPNITSYNGATPGTVYASSGSSATPARLVKTFTTDVDATNLLINLIVQSNGDIGVVSHPKLEEGSVATPFEPCHARARLSSKIITATRDMEALGGDVSYTGLDFTPTSIQCIAFVSAATFPYSISFTDSSKTSISTYTSSDGKIYSYTTIVQAEQAAGYQSAILKTYDAGVGFTLTWTKSSSPTGTLKLQFLCFR